MKQCEQHDAYSRWLAAEIQAAIDDPRPSIPHEEVMADLYPDDEAGFTLYARQGRTLHAVTYDGRPVRFRTFEKALTTLADVAHLSPEIIVDSSNWREAAGPM